MSMPLVPFLEAFATGGAAGGRIGADAVHLAILHDSWAPLTEDRHSDRKLDVKVDECMDTADWFPTRATDGVNLFRTYFDCDCAGDLKGDYVFQCRLEDYCYTDLVDGVTELCINWNITFDFSIDGATGNIYDIERGDQCIDYLKGGPTGRVCFVDSNVCSTKLKDDHGLTTIESLRVCKDRAECPDVLVNQLGYTEDRARELCPAVTMGGEDCLEFRTETCEEHTDNWFYSATHDCSNVEPCAKSSCRAFKKIHPGPERTIHVYPECVDHETGPTANTSATIPAMGSPPPVMTGGTSEDRECEELNERAQTLYDGIDCALARSIIQNGDVMAGIGTPAAADGSSSTSVRDAVCSAEPPCVDTTVGVVEGFIDKGCTVTGEGVGKFIYPIYYENNDFRAAKDFFCSDEDCYISIQTMINTCPDDITDACIEPLQCACLNAFLDDLGNPSEDFQEDYMKNSTISLVKLAQEKCPGGASENPSFGETDPTTLVDGTSGDRQCEQLNVQAQTLYDGIDCALARFIIQNGDVVAGIGDPADGSNPFERDAICRNIGEPTCVDGVVEVVEGFIDEGCTVTGEGVGKFIYPIYYESQDFGAVTDYFCGEEDCYTLVQTMASVCLNSITDACIEPAQCKCFGDFLDIVGNSSDDFQEDYIENSTISSVTLAQQKCTDKAGNVSSPGETEEPANSGEGGASSPGETDEPLSSGERITVTGGTAAVIPVVILVISIYCVVF